MPRRAAIAIVHPVAGAKPVAAVFGRALEYEQTGGLGTALLSPKEAGYCRVRL